MDWKRRKHKPLILQGTRQTGKTTSVDEFSKTYSSYIRINFLEDESANQIFAGDLSAAAILASLRLYSGIHPGQNDTLLLLDEVQNCPRAIQALKFLGGVENLDIIATGSEQGIQFQTAISWPVGYVEYQTLNGLDFEEFLWANGVDDSSIQILLDSMKKLKPVPALFHQKLQDLMLDYMVVGGMPEVVWLFIQEKDYQNVHKKQLELLKGYESDIAQFAPVQIQMKAKACYASLPKQILKQNHKFQYTILEKGAGARKFETALDWLQTSRLVVPVYNISQIQFPLDLYEDISDFRLYPSEIGMMMARFDFEMKRSLLQEKSVEQTSSNLNLAVAKGGLFEALAADMLFKAGKERLHFFANRTHTCELEYVLSTGIGPVPIEIKAGRAKARSLDSILKSESVPLGLKYGSQNIGRTGKKITLPLYLLPFWQEMEWENLLQEIQPD